ncbi:hypothetical protein PG994_014048 [Apiospora phragmitis]|uniref:Uncharacterized protein n=1 Tax=Apiospora phragmitis TaxID=2905665 RepID=A0ABR1T370_9PEZI
MATFPLFGNPPPSYATILGGTQTLPGHLGPALYFYRQRGWGPCRITMATHGYQHANEDYNLGFEFRLDLLGHDHQFDVPIFFVNREARIIARA